MKLLVLSVLFAAALAASHPILLVPGLMGTKLDYTHTGHFEPLACAGIARNTPVTFWIDPMNLSINGQCMNKTVSFACTSEALDARNVPICKHIGDKYVTVAPSGQYPSLDAVRRLDDLKGSLVRVDGFAPIEKVLLESGWTSAEIMAFPYDWRAAPASLGQANHAFDGTPYAGTEIDRFRKIVEDLHAATGKTVTVLSHSMGALMVHDITTSLGAAWAAEHVHAHVSLAPAIAGAFKSDAVAMHAVDFSIVPARYLETLGVTTYPFAGYVGLDHGVTDTSATVYSVVKDGKTTNYTVETYGDAVAELHGGEAGRVYRRMAAYRQEVVRRPTVVQRNHFFISSGERTPAGYTASFDSATSKWTVEITRHVDGDSTVPSKEAKELVKEMNKLSDNQIVAHHVLGISHYHMITNEKKFKKNVLPLLLQL